MMHEVRNAPVKARNGDSAEVLGDLRRVHTAMSPQEAQVVWAEFKQR